MLSSSHVPIIRRRRPARLETTTRSSPIPVTKRTKGSRIRTSPVCDPIPKAVDKGENIGGDSPGQGPERVGERDGGLFDDAGSLVHSTGARREPG